VRGSNRDGGREEGAEEISREREKNENQEMGGRYKLRRRSREQGR
jgi:hypothetical protein